MKNGLDDARGRLSRLNALILIAFGLIALAAAYWTIIRGPSILGRSDNPRLVEAELRVQRGTIFDVNGSPLAITTGEDAELQREYPLAAAAPAVGYYSFRHGTAGIEQAYDQSLRGESEDFWSDFWRLETLGESPTGRDVRLSLDSRWQAEADTLLGDRSGAVLLFSLPDVSVRAMASRPGYDPNNLEEDFERLTMDDQAPLLNRVTQGQYQPGMLLQPFLLAIAQRDGRIELGDMAANARTEVVVDEVSLGCQDEIAGSLTWEQVLKGRCPGPMVGLGEQIGDESLLAALADFGLTSQPELEIVAESAQEPTILDAGLAAIGQDALAVSPLQVGLALAALANEGAYQDAKLVDAAEDESGQWIATEDPISDARAVPAEVAGAILDALTIEEGILEHDVVVLSGPESGLNSWYMGLAPATQPRYGIVVVVENDDDAREIGRALLKSVLNPDQ